MCQGLCRNWGDEAYKTLCPTFHNTNYLKTLVYSYFDYCSPLWDNCGKVLENKLQKFQYCVARIITGTSYDVRSADVFDTLGWETFDARRSPKKSILLYKILNHHTAPNLKGLFRKKNVTNQNAYYLRKSETDLMVAIPKTEFLGTVVLTEPLLHLRWLPTLFSKLKKYIV